MEKFETDAAANEIFCCALLLFYSIHTRINHHLKARDASQHVLQLMTKSREQHRMQQQGSGSSEEEERAQEMLPRKLGCMRKKRRRKNDPAHAGAAVAVLCDENEFLSKTYDAHFFPHVNVDVLRLRFLTASLFRRCAARFRQLLRQIEPDRRVARMASLFARNRHKYLEEDDTTYIEYCAGAVIHTCEYVVCKAEGVLYETTDAEDVVVRARLKKGCKDVGAMETCLLSVADWRIWAETDALCVAESAAAPDAVVGIVLSGCNSENAADFSRTNDFENCGRAWRWQLIVVPRYVEADTSDKIRDVYDHCFERRQANKKEGADALNRYLTFKTNSVQSEAQ